MTEATGGMMDKARSGRRGVQQDHEQDVILRLLPTLNQGLAMKKVSDLRVGCYMILSVIASKGALDDKMLTAMMEAVVLGWTAETMIPGLVCLSVLAQHRSAKHLPKRVIKELLKIPNLHNHLTELSKQRRTERFANSICLAVVDRLRKNGEVLGLPVVQHVIENCVLSDSQAHGIIKALVLIADQLDDSTEPQRIAKPHVASTLVSLSQLTGALGTVVKGALRDSDVDMDLLELKLHTTICSAITEDPTADDKSMEDSETEETKSAPSFEALLQQLPKRTMNESSFLTNDPSNIYADLCRAFLVATAHNVNLISFDATPVLRRDSAFEDTSYFTFYMKIWCGPYPVVARVSALQMVTQCLSASSNPLVDFQMIIPYALVGLADPSVKVRRAAAELLIVINGMYPSSSDIKKKSKQMRTWSAKDLYGNGGISELSPDAAARFVGDILLPALEECVLDDKHIEALFLKTLNGSKSVDAAKKEDSLRLPKTIRASIMSFLASHLLHTPLFNVKLRLLSCLNQVKGVADMTRTKILLPVLQQWAALDILKVETYCHDEHIEPSEFDGQVLLVITATDADGLEFLAKIISGNVAAKRPALMKAAYSRLRAIWPSLKGELRLSMAQILMDLAQGSLEDGIETCETAIEEAADFLRTTVLVTDILSMFLDQLPTAAKLVDEPPATKRRRTSHGQIAKTPLQNPKQLAAAIRKVTFVLQLVDSSKPAEHPELLKGLFNTLAELQHFKAQVSSELAYLQDLVLGSLLAMLNAHRSNPKIKFNRSAVRADLLVDCVQKTASPQVQNSALLLIASLANTAPELVLHSVMPIFTFMGSSVLRQNDEYSAHVISQTIREVIPPLILSLRKEKGNPVTGAAELLLSFVAAYEHVPPHRRKGLFTSLIQTLGPEDFMFALLAMLVDKYGPTDKIKSFAAELSGSFSVEIQLQSAIKYLELVEDILKPKPTFSTILLSTQDNKDSDPQKTAVDELILLPHLLSQKKLITQTGKLLERDDMDAARIRDLYSHLLENVLALADTTRTRNNLHGATGDILESLLGLLSTSEFVKSVESLLDRPNESLRRKILRSLEVRIDQESSSDTVSRVAMLSFLPQLTAIIRESQDVLYKHTAVACVDKISEKYGKKDLEAVGAAAETIASKHCLGQLDDRLRVMALLCLASLVEILQEGIVAILPTAIPKALEYMEMSINSGVEAQKLHDAGYAFFGALVHHLPYMVSGSYLDKLLEISNVSAEANFGDNSDESRIQCLQLAAKQIDAKSMFGALERNWVKATNAGATVSIVDPFS
jgi:U3 small nucleolar RNA-associated protein 10